MYEEVWDIPRKNYTIDMTEYARGVSFRSIQVPSIPDFLRSLRFVGEDAYLNLRN